MILGDDIQALLDEEAIDQETAEWLVRQPENVKYAVVTGIVECCEHNGSYFAYLNMSDTFAYACADAEAVKPEDIDELIGVYKQWGDVGLICWSAKRRGYDPVVEYTEDPVYQETWAGMYGDLRLERNPCNTAVRRWSNSKLNLKRWVPANTGQ